MTSKEQSIRLFRMYLACRDVFPWIARYAVQDIHQQLNSIGGMAGSWRTDYSECTYYVPQLINGKTVDLSTVEKVRDYYEGVTA
jgi:hypothetical protein